MPKFYVIAGKWGAEILVRQSSEILEAVFLKVIRGAWVAQSVKHPTSAQVMISRFVSSSPASGSVLTAQSLEPALNSVCVCLSLCPSPAHILSLSLLQKINIKNILYANLDVNF